MMSLPATNQQWCPRLHAAARAWGIDLSPAQLQQFHLYYAELVEWNQKCNLTAITAYEPVQIQHFLDSLSCLLGAAHFPQHAALGFRVIDIGAGAGFPGLPLKIVHPEWELTLVEATRKKTAFLQHISQQLDSSATIVAARAEDVGQDPQHRARYDVALARAVAALPVLWEYMLPLCRVGGVAVAMKGHAAREEAETARHALEILGGELRAIIPVELPGLMETRHLVIVAKTAPTPPQYPRRAGLPAKKPL